MTTPRDLIKYALQDLGVLAVGEAIDADEVTDLFSKMNLMIDAWSSETSLIYEDVTLSKALTANQGTYTIGSGGDIDETRPMAIKTAYVTISNLSYPPMELIDETEYARITQKTLGGQRPVYLYYNPASPLGTIKLHPLPNGSETLYLEVWQKLASFTSLTQTIQLPEGWELGIQKNFECMIAPSYGKTASPETKELAKTLKGNIKRMAKKHMSMIVDMDVPVGNTGSFDIYSGQSR